MNRQRSWLVAGITTLALALVSTVALGDPSAILSLGTAHGADGHDHLHPRVGSLGNLVPSAPAPAAGTTLRGGEVFTHFQGGRRAEPHATATTETIYTGTTGLEPTVALDQKGNIFFQGVESQGGLPVPVVVVSRDQGRTWDDVSPGTHPLTQDPLLYVDPGTGRAFTSDLPGGACVSVSHTDDVGLSWTTSTACGLSDHQNLSAGPPVSSSTVGYPNIVYLCAIDMGPISGSLATSCLKSLDGGVTWVRTGAPAFTADPRQTGGLYGVPGMCGGGSGHSFVDSKGSLYIPRGWCDQPYLAISEDEGATWERVQVADIGMAQGRDRVCADETCTPDLPAFDHEAAVAVDSDGNIYYFWMATDRLPYLAVSTDGAKSFSKPMMIGPPGLKEAWGPKIDVAEDGKIALAYIGSTNAPGGEAPSGTGDEYTDEVTWSGYITTSINAVAAKPRFVTASVNDPSDPIKRGSCAVGRCGIQYDFIDVVIGPDGRPWTSMVDGCPAPGDSCVTTGLGAGFVGTVVGGPKLR